MSQQHCTNRGRCLGRWDQCTGSESRLPESLQRPLPRPWSRASNSASARLSSHCPRAPSPESYHHLHETQHTVDRPLSWSHSTFLDRVWLASGIDSADNSVELSHRSPLEMTCGNRQLSNLEFNPNVTHIQNRSECNSHPRTEAKQLQTTLLAPSPSICLAAADQDSVLPGDSPTASTTAAATACHPGYREHSPLKVLRFIFHL